jgi:hypothetical protein
MAAAAFVIFHCSSKELQGRAGFDGWVMLLREEFDTEDQAWPQERLRLAGMAKRKMRRLEAAGVELDMLQLVTSCHLLLDPPHNDREEERIWSFNFFRGRMYDLVVRSGHLEDSLFASPEIPALPLSWPRAHVPSQLISSCLSPSPHVCHTSFCSPHFSPIFLLQHDDRELVERLRRFQDELLQSARAAAPSPLQNSRPSAVEGGAQSARPSGDASSPVARASVSSAPADGLELPKALDGEGEQQVIGHGKMTAASLAAALELSDLEAAQQRFGGGGTFLPILPLGSDTDSVERGLPTLPTSTLRL